MFSSANEQAKRVRAHGNFLKAESTRENLNSKLCSRVELDRLNATSEFSSFAWHSIDEVLAMIVDFKRPCYERVFRELGLLK